MVTLARKIKKANAKNRLYYNVTLKLFQLKRPIKTKKAFNIRKERSRKPIVLAENYAKPRIVKQQQM